MQSSRLIPFTVAGIVCFAAAFLLGGGAWYLFGTKPRAAGSVNTNAVLQSSKPNSAEATANTENANQTAAASPTATVATTPEIKKAPAGEIKITGGEVMLGGEIFIDGELMKMPLQRVAVEDFFIGETEVTNAQYAEFVSAVAYKAPVGWKDEKFAAGADDEPVAGISWADANAYCKWLSEEIGATVRLPTEAEWERAARGDNADNKYPWGSEWTDEAAQNPEKKEKLSSVKSFPAGRSPAGVYEMVGNVWEWTGDLAVDQYGKPVLSEKKVKKRIIKGGSAFDNLDKTERDKYLTIDARLNRTENDPSEYLGFRYVVVRK